jgi:lysozyme
MGIVGGKMRALGIDVSVWDGVVDFFKAKAAGASFAFIKASQQVTDAKFALNWKNSKGILPRGAYHYLDWRMGEILQANLFASLLASDPGELPPVLDLEMNPTLYGISPSVLQAKVFNFLTTVEKATGKTPMVYTGYYYWMQFGSKTANWSRYPFWLAWYALESIIKVPAPWTKWNFWQYTDRADGEMFGCQSKGVDMSYFNGTVEELIAFANASSHPAICPTCGQVWP